MSIAEQYITEENTPKNATLFQSPLEDNSTAKTSALIIQQGLNLVWMKDKNGKPLEEDGFFGPKTQETFNRYWDKRFPTKPNYLSSIVKTSSFPYPAIYNYYTEPKLSSWNFSSYPATSSHPTSTSFDSSKQEFDVTDDISIYKKELRAAQKRKEEDDAYEEEEWDPVEDSSYLHEDLQTMAGDSVSYHLDENKVHYLEEIQKKPNKTFESFNEAEYELQKLLDEERAYYIKIIKNQLPTEPLVIGDD